MSEVKQVRVDGIKAREIAKGILSGAQGQPVPEIELALVLAYASVAGAVHEYAGPYVQKRQTLAVEVMLAQMAETVVEVGKMSDADVLALTSPAGRRTCQEN
jgi:hypothetical protein